MLVFLCKEWKKPNHDCRLKGKTQEGQDGGGDVGGEIPWFIHTIFL